VPDGGAPASAPLAARWPGAGAIGLAATSGGLYALGYAGRPGSAAWPLSLIAFVPLIVAIDRSPPGPRSAALLGWVSGAVMNLIGFRFLLEVISTHGGFPVPLAALLLGLFAAAQASRVALHAALARVASERARWLPLPWAFALALPVSEAWPVLVEWSFGAATADVVPLLQVADLGGAPLVGAVLASVNAAAASVVLALLAHRPLRASAAAGLLPLGLALAYAGARGGQIRARMAAAPTLRVGIVQGNIPVAPSEASAMTSMLLQRAHHRSLEARGAGLVIWSEAALPFSIEVPASASHRPDGPAHQQPPTPHAPSEPDALSEAVLAQLGGPPLVPTIVGAVLIETPPPAADGSASVRPAAMFNTAMSIDPQGRITGRSDKRILLPFGEYLPGADTLPWLRSLSPASGRFSPGEARGLLRASVEPVAASICYEDVLASEVNASTQDGAARLLVNLTNDGWFGGSAEPWIHLAQARLRAVEQRRYLVRATNSGVSAIVDPTGSLVLVGGVQRDELLLGSVGLMEGRTTFSRLGWITAWGWAAVALALGALTPHIRRLTRCRAAPAR
jgi:apolipoprotein N-acyltransferase